MAATTTANQNLATAQRFYREVYEGGNIELIDELCAPSYVEHEVTPNVSPDREGLKQSVRAYRAAFPDVRVSIEDVITSNDRLAFRLRLTGTFQGEFMGHKPNGNAFDVGCIDIVRFDGNGKALEHWGISEETKMAQQLGLMPS